MELQTKHFKQLNDELLSNHSDVDVDRLTKSYLELWKFTVSIIENRNILARQWSEVRGDTRQKINQELAKTYLTRGGDERSIT
jgi:hypothetical protein